MSKQYSKNEAIGMKYVGAWIPPDVHQKIKQIAASEERTLAYIITRSLKNLAASVPDNPEPTP